MTQTPSICYCTWDFPKYKPGGAEIQQYLMGKELVKRGWDIHFTTTDHGQPQPYDVEGMHIHTTYREGVGIPVIRAVPNRIKYFLALSRANTSIYHQRGAGETTGYISLFCKLKRRKFVFTAAHIDDCTLPSKMTPLKVKDLSPLYGIRGADQVIVLAEYMRDAMKKNFGIDPLVIKSGHPVPKTIPKKSKEPRVLWVGRFENWKRPEIYVKLAKNFPDITFEIIGRGSTPSRRYVDDIVGMIKQAPNIEYHEFVPFDEIAYHFARAWVLVNTSETEGFPNTYIQAWMMKTPVVALDIDPDNAISTYNLGFHSHTFPQLCEDVNELLNNRNLVSRMGRSCREYAKREHDIVKTTKKHIALYEELSLK